MHVHHPSLWRLPVSLLALALCAAATAPVLAETLEGSLERGPSHSVLWFVSPGSGDLIGQAFANDSLAGRVILNNCLPDLSCVVEGATTSDPPAGLTDTLTFEPRPSGWWLIDQARRAHMQPGLPMDERELHTRFGYLNVNDEQLLLFQGRPVLASSTPPMMESPPQASSSPPSLPARLQAWWTDFWNQLRRQLFALLGRSTTDSNPAPTTPTAQPNGTAETIQGNSSLSLVAHLELKDRDVVLLQDNGGTACPALYRFASITAQGIAVTPEFGTCSDIAAITHQPPSPGKDPEPVVTMTGFLGPFESSQAQKHATMRAHRYVLRRGQVKELGSDSPQS